MAALPQFTMQVWYGGSGTGLWVLTGVSNGSWGSQRLAICTRHNTFPLSRGNGTNMSGGSVVCNTVCLLSGPLSKMLSKGMLALA